jgi:hypothetical protein
MAIPGMVYLEAYPLQYGGPSDASALTVARHPACRSGRSRREYQLVAILNAGVMHPNNCRYRLVEDDRGIRIMERK